MTHPDSRVTIHMAASLDGFIARKDGHVDWLETADEFADGETMDPGVVEAFLQTIDCYVMGSRTYETALRLEAQGLGWAYGDTPTFVLTSRTLPRTRDSVEFHSGDLAKFVNARRGPRANPHTRTMEFSLRDPDGFQVAFILSVRALLSLRSGHSVPPRPAPAP